MAPPGTIIGQIQTSGQPTASMQVAPTPSQPQQIQQGTPQPQTITISSPQQVPLPPTVPSLKVETHNDSAGDGVPQAALSGLLEAQKDGSGDGE